jgi:TetR/AcrR family transcriptional regulator, regulator of cefoperazone and chloramphenicol sensitivity
VAIRKDGVQSSEKLLKAAMAVFAEKGYKKTTIAQICKRAGCNVAAVNYHFRSKNKLYAVVWKNAFEEAMKIHPPNGDLPPDAPAEKKLHALISSHLHRILDDGRLGCSGQILLREMAEPTEAIQQIFHDTIAPLCKRTQEIISELLGPSATEQNLRFCELSVVHQFIAMGFRKSKKKLPPFFRSDNLTTEIIDQLAEHITLFSLAGIVAIRKKTESMPKGD